MDQILEEWRPVVGYEGLYEVSSLGRVKGLERWIYDSRGRGWMKKEKIMKAAIGRHGYRVVSLTNRERNIHRIKTHTVHALVAAAFLGPRPAGLCVLHGPKGKTDNSISNLRYGTASENSRDRIRDGTLGWRLSEESATWIRARLKEGEDPSALASEYGVKVSTILSVRNRKVGDWLDQEPPEGAFIPLQQVRVVLASRPGFKLSGLSC